MRISITFDPATEVADVERFLAGLRDHPANIVGDADDGIDAVINRAKPAQRAWMNDRVAMCREAGLYIGAPNSKHIYLRMYDLDSAHPNRTIVMVHPERSAFMLPATVTDEYNTDDVYRVEDDERVCYRGRDPELFRKLMHRTIQHMRS